MKVFASTRLPLISGLVCLFLSISTVFAQSITIPVGDYQVDNGLRLIICNKIPSIPSSPQTLNLIFDKTYSYASNGSGFEVGKEYVLSSASGSYKLYFTTFPLISFNTNGQPVSEDDNRTPGMVAVGDGINPVFTASMGIRVRGNTSRLYPKKSFNMELWKDSNGNEELETSLLGMREDSKWLFLALYNEPLRVNNAAAWASWLRIHQLYFLSQEPGALAGIRMRYCDVFINNSYHGVYAISEDLDRKQLKLKKTRDSGEIRGELYKSGAKTDATAFLPVFNNNLLPPFYNNSSTWAGYEMDYPKAPYWNNLSGLVNFIAKSSDGDFKSQVGAKFKLDNLIDVFLFLNAIGATEDNFGNNQFFARYKENEPYLLLPWDFDVSFGNINNKMDASTENIRSNGFFHRLLTLNPSGFKSRMRKRWFALRQGELATATFKKRLTDTISQLTSEGAYKREELRWPSSLRLSEQTAILTWIDNRMVFLDKYFSDFPEQDPSAVDIGLQTFVGHATDGGKLLQWSTSIEKESSRFEIEFSTDGLTYSKVGQVAAAGNSGSTKTYSFTHPDVSPVAYYRLKLINQYELFTYSPVVVIGGCASPPAAPSVSASLTAINAGQSTVLKATGCANTVLWNTGQTGSQITVTPGSTTVYQALCRQAAGCESALSAPVSVSVTIPTAYEGYLTTASCTVISGWAWDGKKPNSPVSVEILEGQTVVAYAVADIFRPDLKSAGKGNGQHAYAFDTPASLKDNKPHTLSARVKGSTVALKLTPKSLTCPPTNAVPVAPAIAPLSATLNTAYSRTLPMFFDGDYGAMFYSLSGLPNGLSFSPIEREITGTPTVSGTFPLTYSANDGQVTTTQTVNLVVKESGSTVINQPPQAPVVNPLSATVNAGFSTTLPAFTDTDPLTYSLDGLPNGLAFNSATRQITGTPTASGAFSLTYTATDPQQARSTLSISLTVSPAITTPATVTGNFEGYLDKVECGSIRGWVWDRNKPNTPLMVEFFANNVSIGTALADIYRQDLKNAGKGNGAHVYNFPTPSSVKTGTPYQISAKVQNSNFTLSWSPKSLTCPSGSRESAEEAEGTEELVVWPNPTSGRFEVSYRLEADQGSELSVVDGEGRIWYCKNVEGVGVQRQVVSLTGAQGVFVVQMRRGNTLKTKKIIIGR
ncbi:CotH kinase family protein [Larkinella sp. VNQ87]|uniref:CotH kinase family protein n=1 Tax=Larkinella sp. VNQ87 TaxID=3400921 RepID=UPI003C0DEC3B